jgi:glycosyltransferase involved in cell wall biosynthesis
MRVVLATDAHTPGGVGRHVEDLATGLMSRGIEVSLAGPRSSAIADLATDLRIPFAPFADGPDRADVWHLHLARTYDLRTLPVLARARLTSRRVVVTEHLPRSDASDASLSHDPRTFGAATAKTAFKRLQLGLAHSVIAVSEGSRRFLMNRYGLDASRVVTIHNGVDVARFAPTSARVPGVQAPTVVAVGSLIRQKGHDVLIRAAARARTPWRIAVAGTGPQLEALERLAEEVAPGRVAFHGWVEDVASLMRESAAVCLPSRWESFNYALLDAMTVGRPVIASRVDGTDEALSHGASGLLVPPNDPVALAAAVDQIVEDSTLAGHLAATARRDVAAFGLDHMIDKTITHYRSLL